MRLTNANKILENAVFREELANINALEKERKFCRHGMEHLLDVARIALILCKEKGVPVDPDVIYSAALLHDIGRGEEYRKGEPHNIAGERIAREILSRIGSDKDFTDDVLSLILSHRDKENPDKTAMIFYMADKKSRRCFDCASCSECNWAEEKKNKILEI